MERPLEIMTEAKTTGDVAQLIEYYHELQEEIARLEASKTIARDTLFRAFQSTGMNYLTTASGLKASINTRITERINVKEARALLPEDLFEKLRQESTVVTLTVRKLKEKE